VTRNRFRADPVIFPYFSVTVSGFNGKSHEIGIKVLTKPGRFPRSIPQEKYAGNEGRNAGKRCLEGCLRSVRADDYLEGQPPLPGLNPILRGQYGWKSGSLTPLWVRSQPGRDSRRRRASAFPLRRCFSPSICTQVRLLTPPRYGMAFTTLNTFPGRRRPRRYPACSRF